MTQAEIEAELKSQRQQLLQMQQRLEESKKDKRRFAQIIGVLGLVFMAAGIITALVMTHLVPAPAAAVFGLTGITLILLAAGLAL